MSIHSPRGKAAETFWQIVLRMKEAALVRASPKTGRTHQIRVHLASMGHPILGDPVYGSGRSGLKTPIPRLMLHAWRLVLTHPVTGRTLTFHAALPQDMREVIRKLRGLRDLGR